MTLLLTLYDTNLNGYIVESIDVLSIVALFFGIAVIINKNSIWALMFLIGLFATISCYLILLGLTFIGFSYLIVYIGAVSILFLFILMLIDIRTSELQSNNWNSIPLALFVAIILNYSLDFLLPYCTTVINSNNSKNLNLIIFNVMFVTSKNWDGNITETSHISTIGNILYTSYNIWLINASIILLLAMVGAIVITIKQDTNKQQLI